MKLNDVLTQFIKKALSKTHVFWLVVLIVALPIMLASYFYMHGSFQGSAHKKHGTLLTPPILVSELLLKTSQPQRQPAKPHWTLIYFQQSPCQRQCEKRLYSLRQIHIALGKDSSRLQRVFYATQLPLKLQRKKLDGMGFHIVQGSNDSIQQLNARLSPAQRHTLTTLSDGTVILVDPHGYFVLFYSKNFKPKDILSDLRHLLKLSPIG